MRSFRFRHTHLYVLKAGCTGHGPQRLTKGPIILNETLVKLHRFGQHVCNDKHTHTFAAMAVVSSPHPPVYLNNYMCTSVDYVYCTNDIELNPISLYHHTVKYKKYIAITETNCVFQQIPRFVFRTTN